jgi:crossover junction endodeoxyribonuclease RuvC
MGQAAIRIIGIDPGLRITGWGIIESRGADIAYVGSGSIRSDDRKPIAARLRELHDGLAAIIIEYGPSEAAVEETFVNRDPQSAL